MSDGLEQAGLLRISSPLGENDLLMESLEGTEAISEPFLFHLFMRSASSDLDASKIVGKSATVTIALADGPKRYINGIVSRFVQTGGEETWASYRAELVPKLWLLSLSRDRKIYQGKTIAEIIKAVLGDAGIVFDDQLSGSYTALDYCVQYDESPLDFISRLMERAGIFYFFKFANGSHTMVLGDAAAAHPDCSDAATVRFFPETQALCAMDTIARFESEHSVTLKKVTVSDFNYDTPSTSLEGSESAEAGAGLGYEFPAGHEKASDAQALAKLRLQAAQVSAQTLRGQGYAYPFAAGAKFKLTDHFAAALNTTYVLRRVHHTSRDDLYSNAFEAFASTVPFRPPLRTAKPRAVGAETAKVVGSSGEEIWTDKLGRIKVQFPWDRDGQSDEKSSVWLRVAQPLAGKGFGALFLPRIGHEVVVSYLHGDPDRPLVTGSVYNGENDTPVSLPTNQTQSTIKTRSSKDGQAGNEIRFEDKKDSEQLYVHAQKDLVFEVEDAWTSTVKKGDHTHTLDEGNLKTTVTKGAHTHTVEEGDLSTKVNKGAETHHVQGTRKVDVVGDETHDNAGAYTHEVKGDYKLTIKGDLTIEVTGAVTIKSSDAVSVSSAAAMTLKGGSDLTAQAAKNLNLKGGAALEGKAPMVNVKADGMGTLEAGGILTLKGSMAKIN